MLTFKTQNNNGQLRNKYRKQHRNTIIINNFNVFQCRGRVGIHQCKIWKVPCVWFVVVVVVVVVASLIDFIPSFFRYFTLFHYLPVCQNEM